MSGLQITIDGFRITAPVVTLGIISGLTYGILAVGLILVYRTSRMINFAHGAIGGLGAAVLAVAVTKWHFPYWVALPIVLLIGAGVGGASEVLVVRRLRGAPLVVTVIATLGLAQFLQVFSGVVDSALSAGHLFPQPAFMPKWHLGPLLVTPAYFAMLVISPVVVAGLTWFLRRSWLGQAIRAVAVNPEAARMAGIPAGTMSVLAWALAGALATYTAVLILPTQSFGGSNFLGPGLMVRALTAAVVARMVNLPVALGAGVGIGIIEQELLYNYPSGGLVEAALFVIILLALLLQPPAATGRNQDKGSWALVTGWRPIPPAYRNLRVLRRARVALPAAGAAIGLLLPVVVTNASSVVLGALLAFSVVGLSVGVVTGLGGQLSLGQFAFAGIGATVSYVIVGHTSNFAFGLVGAGIVTAGVSLVIGLPALRVKGLMLAVASMGFALAAENWLFQQHWMLGTGVNSRQPIIAGMHLNTGKKYYFFALGVFAVALWLARNIWVSGLGLRLRAVRDNEDAARSFSIRATAIKLQAFVTAGFLAGLGGAVYGHSLSLLSSKAFPIDGSLNTAAMAVLGGIGALIGPLLGALYIIGIPQFVPLDSAGLAATSLGWLLVILQFPGGLVQAFDRTVTRALDIVARRSGLDPAAERAALPAGEHTSRGPNLTALPARPSPRQHGVVLLEATGLDKSFGGIHAVDNANLQVLTGETVGLIGPNGAGKTTLFELLGGFTQPDRGRVVFDGRDITSSGPEERARRGLVRSFQDAALFPTLTVLESVTLALERELPASFLASVAGFHGADRKRRSRAAEMVDLMGLGRYANAAIKDLSTGTRRIAEFACLVSVAPVLLLLDEPSSGIAQKETEALGALIASVKRELDVTLVIIEHDIPLIMSLSDRVIAMDTGRIIASGTPAEVRNDPHVMTSYLGDNAVAIERSNQRGPGPVVDARTCAAITRAGNPCRRRADGSGFCGQHKTVGVAH